MTNHHTPGPWELEVVEDGFEIRMATAIENRGYHDTNHLIEWDLCMTPDDGEQYAEAIATARLITAAPDLFDEVQRLRADRDALLAALRKAHTRLQSTSISRAGEARNKEDGLKEIEAAIAQAEA